MMANKNSYQEGEIMKRLGLIFTLVVFLPVVAFGQYTINSFDQAAADTNYWKWYANVNEGVAGTFGGHYAINANASTDLGWIKLNHITSPLFGGAGALEIQYSVQNKETWGGFSKIEHWNPDSTKVYDFSNYDSISVMYYNTVPQSIAGRITLRLCLHDASDSPNGYATYANTQVEYYYSFLNVLDMTPGWNEIKMPLKADPNYWAGEGFNRTGWVGITGNGVLDLDKIKGFTFEFSVSGTGDGDVVSGTVVFDEMKLKGPKAIPFVIFNGMTIPGSLSSFTWGQSGLGIETGAGENAGTNALKWVQGNEWSNGWTGAGYNISPAVNLSKSWAVDSLKFTMKATPGTGAIRFQFEDGAAKVGKLVTPIADDAWHNYAIKLSDMTYQDGTANFNPANVTVFQFMAEANAVAGNTIYFNNIWTGEPVFDWVAPVQVKKVNAVKYSGYNLVIWEDVPGESGEVYNVYASAQPISDVKADGIQLIGEKIAESTQSAIHYLYYPLVAADVTMYYAVECVDASGNVGPAGVSGAVVNAAEAVPTISLNPPASFVADADLSEWYTSGIKPWKLRPETHTVSTGTVTDSLDLKVDLYLAMDQNNFYIAFDAYDDVFAYSSEGDFYRWDAFEMFIGLYDERGKFHTSAPWDNRGAEPDYKLVCQPDRFFSEFRPGAMDADILFTNASDNYEFVEFGSDWSAEVKIPFDSLLIGADQVFHPKRGMKIPLEFVFHDNDGTATGDWQGNLVLSPNDNDNAWQYVWQWSYTWIGDTTDVVYTPIEDESPRAARAYSLSNNYPNPFNPTTTFNYTIPLAGVVTIDVYNTIGQKVKTLVNEFKSAGRYTIEMNASDLTSGIYFYTINAGSFKQTRKMLLIK
jgi:hypothetical protein